MSPKTTYTTDPAQYAGASQSEWEGGLANTKHRFGLSVNPFDDENLGGVDAATDMPRQDGSFPKGTIWLVDGPGIGGGLFNPRARAHLAAGGCFVHVVKRDGTIDRT